MLFSVVLRFSAVLGDRHSDRFVISRYGQCAFRLGDVIVVRLRAFVQRIGERVRALACVGLAAGHVVCRTLACHKSVARHRHGVVRQRRLVIDLAVGCARQRYAPLTNHQAAVHDHECYVREVRVRVREVCRRQVHIICSRVGTRDRRVAAEAEVVRRVQRGIVVSDLDARHIIAGHGMLFSVVLRFSTVLGDRHNDCTAGRRYRQRAQVLFNPVVSGICCAPFNIVGIADAADVCDRTVRDYIDLLLVLQGLCLNFSAGQRLSIIDLRSRFCGDCHFRRVHFQRSVFRSNMDVVRIRCREIIAQQFVYNRAFRYVRDRTFHNGSERIIRSDLSGLEFPSLIAAGRTIVSERAVISPNDNLSCLDRQDACLGFCREILIVDNLSVFKVRKVNLIVPGIDTFAISMESETRVYFGSRTVIIHDPGRIAVVSGSGLEEAIVNNVVSAVICNHNNRFVQLDIEVPMEAVLIAFRI